MQVVNVMLFRPRVYDSHLYGVSDIAVVHVRGIIGIQDLRGLSPKDQVASAVGAIGGFVNYLRRITNRPRREEELLKLALSAVEHGPDTEPVGQNLCAHTGHTIVDSKLVLDAVKCVFENRITKLRKGLYVLDFIMIDHGEFTKRPIAIRFGRIRSVGSGRKASLVWTGDDRIQVRVHNSVDVKHLDDRSTGPGMTRRIHRIVIEDRLASRSQLWRTVRVLHGRKCHFCGGKLRAIPLGATDLDVDAAK